jgi:hypothetical protein
MCYSICYLPGSNIFFTLFFALFSLPAPHVHCYTRYMENGPWKNLKRDIFILVVGIGITVLLVKSGMLNVAFRESLNLPLIASFLAGFFFTSVFTVAPAAIVLGKLAQVIGVIPVALLGGLGAILSDYLMFFFIREKLKNDIDTIIKERIHKNPLSIFKLEFLRWLNPLLGAILIITPLPDEIGLALLGFSKISARNLLITLFVLHFLGIFLLAQVAVVAF